MRWELIMSLVEGKHSSSRRMALTSVWSSMRLWRDERRRGAIVGGAMRDVNLQERITTICGYVTCFSSGVVVIAGTEEKVLQRSSAFFQVVPWRIVLD
jgi:hypothetical protein